MKDTTAAKAHIKEFSDVMECVYLGKGTRNKFGYGFTRMRACSYLLFICYIGSTKYLSIQCIEWKSIHNSKRRQTKMKKNPEMKYFVPCIIWVMGRRQFLYYMCIYIHRVQKSIPSKRKSLKDLINLMLWYHITLHRSHNAFMTDS